MSAAQELFSKKLESWLKSGRPKTLGNLNMAFGGKSFAVAILVLMSIPALPLPTGGLTHIFEIISLLLAGEMVLGVKEIWLPRRFQHLKAGTILERGAIPKLIKLVGWFEARFSPRREPAFNRNTSLRFIGAVVGVFVLFAFIAPPFSGLDTLPSLGAVVVCLSIILDNLAILAIGTTIGLMGIVLILAIGEMVIKIIS